jgi:DeoR family glycerol-3-phosphate regulon repressor
MAGVELRNHDGASFDAQAFSVIRSMRVRLAILSASAVDADRGLMVQERAEAEMSAAMASVAESRVFAIDASKFGQSGLFALAPLGRHDTVVTDRRPSTAFDEVLGGAAIRTV